MIGRLPRTPDERRQYEKELRKRGFGRVHVITTDKGRVKLVSDVEFMAVHFNGVLTQDV